MENYLEINKENWNKRVGINKSSEFYNLEDFKKGQNCLTEIELSYIPKDLSGLKILHLQCHFGMDSMALARMGAEVVGIDFSEKAIDEATKLAAELCLSAKATFVCCDVYSTSKVLANLQGSFDMVFTSYGTIGWLPDLTKWAAQIAFFLKPGGRFCMADFHPVLWMFDNDFTFIEYGYDQPEPIVETLSGTYADKTNTEVFESIGWNHGLAKILQSLINAGISIQNIREHYYSPYNCFANTVKVAENRWQIKGLEGKIPMVYWIEGENRSS